MGERLPDRVRDRLYFGLNSVHRRPARSRVQIPLWLFIVPVGGWLYLAIRHTLDGDDAGATVDFVLAALWLGFTVRDYRRGRFANRNAKPSS